MREKLYSILCDNKGAENIDMNRFEQELIFYLERYDINEEKVRLKKHCEYFLETVESPAPNGKVLGFIAQENRKGDKHAGVESQRCQHTEAGGQDERRTGKDKGTDKQYFIGSQKDER